MPAGRAQRLPLSDGPVKVLYGMAYLMTRDHSLAEDLVQEAFLLAWRVSSCRAQGSFKAWLVRILVNQAINQRRKKRVIETEFFEEKSMFSEPNLGEDLVLQEDERKRIFLALEGFPLEQR